MKSLLSILLVIFFFSACKKSTDETKEGSKAKVSVANFVLNGPMVKASIRDQSVTPSPVGYGETTKYMDSIYYPFIPGFCTVKINQVNSDSNLLGPKNNYVFGSTSAYTFYLFGTNKPDSIYTFITQDLNQPVDTVAKARFYNFIPGSNYDTLFVYLVRKPRVGSTPDTVFLSYNTFVYGSPKNYNGRTYYATDGHDYSGFNTLITADTFNVYLRNLNNTHVIDSTQKVYVDLKKLYTFYAVGEYGDTSAANKPRLIKVLHN